MKFSVDELKNVFNKDKIGDWVVKYKRQVAVGCVAFCLVVFAGVSLAGGSTSGKEGEASPAAADNGQSAEPKKGLWLPEYFINDIDTDPYVWADNGKNRLEKRSVELGEYDENMLEYQIKSGLTKEDAITFPEEGLEEGMT